MLTSMNCWFFSFVGLVDFKWKKIKRIHHVVVVVVVGKSMMKKKKPEIRSFSLKLKIFLIILIGFSFVESQRNCPGNFTTIGVGCYKVYNGSNMTWTGARDLCFNESTFFTTSSSKIVTHLVAIEHKHEKTYLNHWLNGKRDENIFVSFVFLWKFSLAYVIKREFWTDGVLGTNSWNWSGTPIQWIYNDTELNVQGSGSHFKYSFDHTNDLYQIVDDQEEKQINFICELQGEIVEKKTKKLSFWIWNIFRTL